MKDAGRDIDFPAKDQGLRDDVRLLGALVGDMLREQGGAALFERVEAVRVAAIRRREGDRTAADELDATLSGLEPREARELVRAFSTYFQMVNLAERVHRIRRRRAYERDASRLQPEGFADSVARLRDAGVDDAAICDAVSRFVIEPVFTAHPTESTRRTLLEKQQHVAALMVQRFTADMTPREHAVTLARLREEITTAWQTEEHSATRMTVANERDNVLHFLGSVIYRALPVFLEQLEDQLRAAPGCVPEKLLRFGSWVGGDMDGNPNVDHETVLDALDAHRALIIHRYRGELQDLYRLLSQSLARVAVDDAVNERIVRYATLFPTDYESVENRHRGMPYRVLLHLVDVRLGATADELAGAYADADEFCADLAALRDSLARHRGDHAGLFQVQRLLRRARAFGFHLASLDIRQDSGVFRRGLGELLGDANWLERDPGTRAVRIREALHAGGDAATAPGEETAGTLRVFEAIEASRQRFGAAAIGDVVISMAQGVDDVLGVLLLAARAGLRENGEGQVPLDVVPLFETVDDLLRAPEVMNALFEDAAYRRHLGGRGNVQRVMLGYSDSAKDGGVAASRWALQQAQAELAAIARAAGVKLAFFHGRGGTVSRGGGRVHRAVLAAPPGTVNGVLRVTEQGEIINAKYGLRGIALRTFEQMAGAMLIATLAPQASHEDMPDWADAMQRVAAESRRCYRALVHDDPGFDEYFRTVTPVDVIERMKIGSRPAARRKGGGVAALRAIPWVFAWTQNRCILPGWYGLGSGLRALVEHAGLETAQRMARDWPFFANLLDDVEMVLAKTDMDIAQHYFALHPDARPGETIAAEHALTVRMLLEIRESDALLAEDPGLERAIRLRNPYVDPMSFVQVELLREWRATGAKDDERLAALIATVNGIAQGLQNTG